jgi:hypothetical protein
MKKTMIVEVADETCAEPWAEWASSEEEEARGRLSREAMLCE